VACRILCVPTHALELFEIDAARRALLAGEVEARFTPDKPLDVLAQHLVTCALGGGFVADELFEEVRTAWSYRNLTRQEFDWALALVERGGGTLSAYPEFCRVRAQGGLYRVVGARVAQLHRLNVGTIVGDASVDIRYMSGSLRISRRMSVSSSLARWFDLRCSRTSSRTCGLRRDRR
jgi:ATP-dependent Lhr-like helicase